MRRSRSNGPTISLFAFQDIITSVCGILLFVTLLLAVELSQRTEGRPDLPIEQVSDDLQAAVAEARAERDQLAGSTRRDAAALGLAAGRSLAEVEQEVRTLTGAIVGRERDVAELRDREQDAGRRQSEAEARAPQREDLERRRADLETRIAEDERMLNEMKQQDRVVLDVSGVPGGVGWVVDLGPDSIQVAPIDRAAPPRTFRPRLAITGNSAEDQLVAWLDAEASGQYVLLLIRPGGHDRFDAIRDEFKTKGRPFGFDLIGARQTVFDPARGVFRP